MTERPPEPMFLNPFNKLSIPLHVTKSKKPYPKYIVVLCSTSQERRKGELM